MDLNKNKNVIEDNIEDKKYVNNTNIIDNPSLTDNNNLKSTTDHQKVINTSVLPNDSNSNDHKMMSSNFIKLIFVIITLILFIGIIFLLSVNKSENSFQIYKLTSLLDLRNVKNIIAISSIKTEFNIAKIKKLSPVDESKNWQTYDFEEITFKLPENWFTRKSNEPKYFNFDLQKPIMNSSHSSESFAMYIENKKLEETLKEFKNCTKEEFPCYDLTSNEYVVDG